MQEDIVFLFVSWVLGCLVICVAVWAAIHWAVRRFKGRDKEVR